MKKSHIIQPRDRNRKYKRGRPKGQSEKVYYSCNHSYRRGGNNGWEAGEIMPDNVRN